MSRQMKAQSNWRGELSEYAGVLSTYDGYGDLAQQHSKTDTKAKKEIKEDPKIKNKIVINPVVKEAFGEIGALVLELSEEAVVQELTKEDIEELQRKKDAQEGREPARQNVEEDDKWIQKAKENMRKDKPCTGDKFGSDTCPPGSKRYNLAKTFKKMAKEEAEKGISENAEAQAAAARTKTAMMRLRTSKLEQKAEKERVKKQKQITQRDPANEMAVEETINKESALNPFQYHPDKGGTDKGTPEQAKKIAKNISSNRKKGPMKYDPYKGTDGRD